MWVIDIRGFAARHDISNAYQLAKKLGVQQIVARRLLNPRKVIYTDQINMLCNAFPGSTPSDFIVEVPEPKSNSKKSKR